MNRCRSLVLSLLLLVSPLVACSGVDAPVPAAPNVQVSELESVKGVPRSRARSRRLVAIDVGGATLCTGSLVAPDVVLTARHCVAQAASTIQCPATAAQVGAAVDPSTVQVLAGDDVTTATLVGLGAAILVPAGDVLCNADIAFIVLDRATSAVTPLQIATTPVVAGAHVRSVGFGATSDTTPAGIKIVREHVAVQGVVSDEFQIGEATCQGDSGGPAFDETTGQIVGIVSRGGGSCTGKNAFNIYTRTDIFEPLACPGRLPSAPKRPRTPVLTPPCTSTAEPRRPRRATWGARARRRPTAPPASASRRRPRTTAPARAARATVAPPTSTARRPRPEPARFAWKRRSDPSAFRGRWC